MRAELARLAPEREAAQQGEERALAACNVAERAVQDWQERWRAHTLAAGAAEQIIEVERTRIEQLEHQERRLAAQGARFGEERVALDAQDPDRYLNELGAREAGARAASERCGRELEELQGRLQTLRAAQHGCEQQLESVRAACATVRAELSSLEALQAAALADHTGGAAEWLAAAGLTERPRLAAALEVESGWERAVEAALGDYLEAVCVPELTAVSDELARLGSGRITLLETGEQAAGAAPRTLAARVKGPPAVLARLEHILIADSLDEALRGRARLERGESYITRNGEWLGRDWLRVSRGPDPRAGVLERGQRLKALGAQVADGETRVAAAEAGLLAARAAFIAAEAGRDQAQAAVQQAQREHAELLGALDAGRLRAVDAGERRERLEAGSAELAREHAATEAALTRARAELERAGAAADELGARHAALEADQGACRAALEAARVGLQAAQLAARDLHVRFEARRSTESSVAVGLGRMHEQRAQLLERRAALEAELASGDEPIVKAQARLNEALALRLKVEAELGVARGALEEAEAALRALDERRQAAEQQVSAAREALEAARLAAQETHVRRAALGEQFAETGCELAQVLASLTQEATVPAWEQSLAETRADIERLGQVNLAAIDELKEHTQRKEYLDRQFADLNDALETLAEAMRRIDRETRSRFEDTFERINVGLREKFPRLFGGGHAYLELVGEDKLTAGVAVMARPPGKKNSTIHLLSGGEKALTAVALVFSIFDLNPAPFCLLDEVDAPLDEYNVGRFCDIVRDMSARVQFVFITHNKSTMELASQLIGVTMNEPGVSRLVTVDVDEAVRLAAVQEAAM